MNNSKWQKAFTLVELLVVISVIALLMAILLPSLAKSRAKAKILKINLELRQVGIALELYYEDHKEYPPNMADCGSGQLKDHISQLPKVLGDGGYLPAKSIYDPMDTIMEDPFNRGHAYKYGACGEVILDRDIIAKNIKAPIWVPDNFPYKSSLVEQEGKWYDDLKTSPVHWAVYSLGPNFNQEQFLKKSKRLYPIPKQLWYDPKNKQGLIIRVKMSNGRQIGTF